MADAKSKRYEIVSNDGNEAVIRFANSGKKRSFKVVALDTIRTKIQNGEKINLDECYVKDFSYKALCGFSSKPLVNFSAMYSFWDGIVNFRGAEFSDGGVSFYGAHFGDGDVDFHYAHFGDGNVNFSSTDFGDGNASFRYAEFGDGHVSFNYAEFGDGDVDFIGTRFGNGNVNFIDARFGNGDVDFSRAQFGDGEFHFEDITAGETNFSFINQTIHSHFTFRFRALKKLVFDNCISHNVIEFQEAIDKETEKPFHNAIKELAFLNFCNLGTIRLNWNDYKDALMAYKGDSERITDGFKMLKENFHNQGEYDWEDEAYVEFKKRYAKGLRHHPFRKGLLYLLSVVGKFGTDYFSIEFTMLAVVLLWGALYALPFASIYPPDTVHHWWSPLYYSVITFFTVGYGDLSAQNGWTAFLCGFESFLGVFLMSYFSVAVVRKILR